MFGLSLGTVKWIAIGLAILAVVAYVTYLNIRIDYLKAEVTKYESVLAAQEAKRKSLEVITASQDKVRAEQSKASSAEIFRLQNQNVKVIHENKSLSTVVIPELARQLFNSTVKPGPDKIDTAGKTDTPDAQAGATLDQLLVANEANKANYLQCAEDKEEWQKLWKETEVNLSGTH